MANRSEARKARWAKMTPEKKSAMQSKIASNAWKNRTAKERKARAVLMNEARWGKKKKK